MGFFQELRSGQYTIYAQWCALISVPLLIILGIVELATLHVFAILAFEVPLCLKCCPTSQKFDNFMKRFENNYFRAGMYGLFALIEWLSLTQSFTIMVIAAITLTIAAVCYAFAGAKNQDRATSKITGGTGVEAAVATNAYGMA
ncbi:Golgi apparatus membrane protein tvp18 [Syncephalis fuscata]|nr:Golgi apparatus membrane protein tvp18 [Syncephalis fuscata]